MSYTEVMIWSETKETIFKMYNGKGLAKDKKIIETQSYKDWIAKNIEDAEVETIEELEEFWNDCGFDGTWEEHKLSQMINGMMKEKILVFNPALQKEDKAFYLPSEVIVY